MKKTFNLLFIILFISCQRDYFEFDKVEHYVTSASENQISKLYEPEANENNKVLSDFLFENYFPAINKDLENKLVPFYKFKSGFDNSETEKIHEIYRSKITSRLSASKCLPVYRDLLVFKKNGKITGISKICFDCRMAINMDAIGNLYEIDMDDYDKLEKILE